MVSLAQYRGLAATLMLLAILQFEGLHWVGFYAASKAVQSFKAARSQGVIAAIQRIPKGSGKCAFCKKIQLAKTSAEKQQQQQRAAMQQLHGSSFLFDAMEFAVSVPVYDAGRSSADTRPWDVRGETPPTPPPQLA